MGTKASSQFRNPRMLASATAGGEAVDFSPQRVALLQHNSRSPGIVDAGVHYIGAP
jgi:hypothetical protein